MNTLDVIVGALIGMGVSIITSLVSHWLENSRNKQVRVWQVEDRQYEENFKMLKTRIDLIESTLNELRDYVSTKTDKEIDLLNVIDESTIKKIAEIVFVKNNDELISEKLLKLKQEDEPVFMKASQRFIDFLDREKDKSGTELDFLARGTSSLLSNVVSLRNSQLLKDVGEYIETITGRISLYRKIQIIYTNGGIVDVQMEKDTSIKYISEVLHVHGKIISQLDVMRTTGKYKENING